MVFRPRITRFFCHGSASLSPPAIAVTRSDIFDKQDVEQRKQSTPVHSVTETVLLTELSSSRFVKTPLEEGYLHNWAFRRRLQVLGPLQTSATITDDHLLRREQRARPFGNAATRHSAPNGSRDNCFVRPARTAKRFPLTGTTHIGVSENFNVHCHVTRRYYSRTRRKKTTSLQVLYDQMQTVRESRLSLTDFVYPRV